jgi:hypothetical protein
MIHLQNMFSETNTSTAGQSGRTPSSQASLSQSSLASFHGALSDAVSSTLEKFGIHPRDVEISITRASAASSMPASGSPTTGDRTAPPTPGTPASGSGSSSDSSSSSASTSSSASSTGTLEALFNSPYTQPTQAPAKSSTESTSAPLDAQQAFDNAYWAQQPAAVQPLRTMQNPEQRAALATQLAGEGYSIDVPIMVWGWDPSIVTSMRQADGYTWVPSALQNPVETAPGLPGMGTDAAYNPNSAPAGSIAV